MSSSITVVEGTIKSDGTLELHEKLNLPAGKVQVTLVPVPSYPRDDPLWNLMEGIWADQRSRGHVARSAADVEAERQASRNDWDERMTHIRRIQEEAERLRAVGAPVLMVE